MSFKKNLKTGQATVEYFILFAIIGALTIIGASTFLNSTQDSSKELFRKAAARIVNP